MIDASLLPPNLICSGKTAGRDASLPGEMAEVKEEEGSTALEAMEKQMIRDALTRYSNKKQAADELGIGIATLYRKIKKYELIGI